jgi:hypothetical protein
LTETFNLAIPGPGCTIAYCLTSGGTYVPVTQVKSIDGPGMEVGMWDSTGLSSAAGEQVPTIFKAGEVGFKIIYDPSNTTHAALTTDMLALTLLYWKLTFASPVGPGATVPGSPKTYGFAGYLKGFALSGFETESDVEADVKIAITGLVTLT